MKVKFVPQNIELEVSPDRTLLQFATENGIEIKSICKGVPSCAECRVRVVEGESNVLPPNKAELELIGTNWRIDSRRLACQLRCYGDIVVDMTEQIQRQENQSKKVRGYRSSKQAETQAVQDTMILTEKPDLSAPAPQVARSQEDSQGQGKGGGGGRNQKGKQHPQQGKPQNKNQNQQNQGKQQSGKQNQPKQQQPKQQQQAKQQQGKGGGRPQNGGQQGGGQSGGQQGGRNRDRQNPQQAGGGGNVKPTQPKAENPHKADAQPKVETQPRSETHPKPANKPERPN